MPTRHRSYRTARGAPIPPLETPGTRSAEAEAGPRRCAHPGCTEPGEFRAPKDRSLSEYLWFCLPHVQEYNKQWNYYAGMNETEIEDEIRRSTTWNRPTWKLGERATDRRKPEPEEYDDPLGVFEEEIRARARQRAKDRRDAEARRRKKYGMETPEAIYQARKAALRLFDLDDPIDPTTLKTRYKSLVKRWHPDANGGAKDAEERFKEISAAYRLLTETMVD